MASSCLRCLFQQTLGQTETASPFLGVVSGETYLSHSRKYFGTIKHARRNATRTKQFDHGETSTTFFWSHFATVFVIMRKDWEGTDSWRTRDSGSPRRGWLQFTSPSDIKKFACTTVNREQLNLQHTLQEFLLLLVELKLVVVQTDPLHPGLNGLDAFEPRYAGIKGQKSIFGGLHFLQENVQGIESDKLK